MPEQGFQIANYELLNEAAGPNSPRITVNRSSRGNNWLESIEVTGLSVVKDSFDAPDTEIVAVRMATDFRTPSRSLIIKEITLQLDKEQSDKVRNGGMLELPPIVQEISEKDNQFLSEILDRGDRVEFWTTVNLQRTNTTERISHFHGLLNFMGFVAPSESN